MNHASLSRRRFLSTAAAGLAAVSTRCARTVEAPTSVSAVDEVPLGRSGARICRLGFGTGTDGGAVQRGLGEAEFSRLIRYAYDQGITYIDTADAYETHGMIRTAIQGLPRERLWIQTKMPWQNPAFVERPLEVIDRYRQELGTDYLDSLLIHCTTTSGWPQELRSMMDAFEEAKQRGWIRLKGVSCHGLPALRTATSTDWVDLHLVRINPQGRHCDGDTGDWSEPGQLDAAMQEITAMHRQGRGMIGMKIIGNGEFTDPAARRESIRFALSSGVVDSMVIGFKTTGEIDEALRNLGAALRA